MAGWHEQAPPSSDHVYASICQAGSLSFEPGARYEYCDSNYFLLARAIGQVTGDRFGAFIEQRILRPFGMNDSAILDNPILDQSPWAEGYVQYPSELLSPYAYRAPEDDAGFHPARLSYAHVGAEGLRTTAADLLTLGRHLAGPSNVLSASIRERVLHTPRVRDDGFGYGYGLNVGMFRGMRFFGHSGEIQGFTATMICFPDEELHIACLTNRQDVTAWACRNAVLDELLGNRPSTREVHEASAGKSTWPHGLPGSYMDPISARLLKIVMTEQGFGVSLDGGPASMLRGSGPWSAADGILIIRRDDLPTEGEHRSSLIVQKDHVASTYAPFIRHIEWDDLKAYEGVYACGALDTSFRVAATDGGLRFTNQDASHPSMDLDYFPTIRDFFWSHDPHPELSQVQFLRNTAGIYAFVYRDYDGDRREDFRFVRSSG
jgi:hypothetical protein